MTNTATQQERILGLLRKGPVTPLHAWIEAGIYRAADPIEKLRKRGFKIKTDMMDFKTTRGFDVKLAKYTLVREPKRERKVQR